MAESKKSKIEKSKEEKKVIEEKLTNRISTQQALPEFQRVPVCMKRRFRCAA